MMRVASLVVVCAFPLVGGCDNRHDDHKVQRARLLEHLLRNGTSVQRAFAAGDFQHGDAVEKLIETHPALAVIRHPPYVTIYYTEWRHRDWGKELQVVAKDGRLIHAKTSVETGPRQYTEVQFFGDIGYGFDPAYSKSLEQGIERWVDERMKALMAVTGAPAWSR